MRTSPFLALALSPPPLLGVQSSVPPTAPRGHGAAVCSRPPWASWSKRGSTRESPQLPGPDPGPFSPPWGLHLEVPVGSDLSTAEGGQWGLADRVSGPRDPHLLPPGPAVSPRGSARPAAPPSLSAGPHGWSPASPGTQPHGHAQTSVAPQLVPGVQEAPRGGRLLRSFPERAACAGAVSVPRGSRAGGQAQTLPTPQPVPAESWDGDQGA